MVSSSPSAVEDVTSVAKIERLPEAPKLKFSGNEGFFVELKRRVDAYFRETGKQRRDCWQMYLKTAMIVSWFVASYLSLLLLAHHWYVIAPLALSMGLSVAAVGFNIQHDGGHKAYSDRPWINKLAAFSLDMMGGSSYLWDWKHNSIHHTFPNVAGQDDDIDVGALARLAPEQPRLWFHRFQGIYIWLLYGFLTLKWHLFDDFHNVAVAHIGPHRIPRPKGGALVSFIIGKVFFFSIAFVIPLCLHPIWAVLVTYAGAAIVCGITLSVVFQLAHCVGEAQFPVPVNNAEGLPRLNKEWAIHQVETTVDFARGNPFLCWFLGGLNFQVEHHLLHRICHIHYPALSKVVEGVCRDFGIQYYAHKTFWSALASHFNWLVRMGRPIPVPATVLTLP